MESPITSTHWNDTNGNPAGGATYGHGFAISWQNGPLNEPGGDTAVESATKAMSALNLAIEYLKAGPPSRSASIAITNAEQASMWAARITTVGD